MKRFCCCSPSDFMLVMSPSFLSFYISLLSQSQFKGKLREKSKALRWWRLFYFQRCFCSGGHEHKTCLQVIRGNSCVLRDPRSPWFIATAGSVI
jgi:hypothetical protein